MMRSEEADLLRRASALPSPLNAPSTPNCLDDDMVAGVAEGTLDPEIHATLLPHLAECARCRTVVASVARALGDPAVAREARAVERDGPRPVQRIGRIAVGIAAVAALLLLARPPRFEEPLPHRAPSITAAPAPEAVWPVGSVADARSLRWTTVAGADRYRVSLFDAQGRVLYESVLAGTEAVLPDSVQLAPRETYWWKVDARLGFDRWAASELVEFSIAGAPSR